MNYIDRQHAGQVLAELLSEYDNQKDTIVLGLPRGGVPVAYEVARKLNLPLDVLIVRKLGVPCSKELAMGAVASGDIVTWNQEILDLEYVSQEERKRVLESEKMELAKREEKYRGTRLFPQLEDKTVILVDDGIATGSTIKAGIAAIKEKNPKNIIVAVPVGAPSSCREIAASVQTLICPLQPKVFGAVGLWYENFSQTEDEEVIQLLRNSSR